MKSRRKGTNEGGKKNECQLSNIMYVMNNEEEPVQF